LFPPRAASFSGEKQVVKNSYKHFKRLSYFHFAIMYSSYALAIWYGARFILGKGYTGGQVLNVFDVKLLHSVASDLLLKVHQFNYA